MFWYLSLYANGNDVTSLPFFLGTHKEKLKNTVEINKKHTLLRIYIFFFFSFWFLNSFSLPLPYDGNLWYRMLGIFIILHKSFFCLSTAAAAAVLLWLLAKNQSIFILYVCVCVSVCFWKGPNISLWSGNCRKKHKQNIYFFFFLENDMPLDLFGLEILTILLLLLVSCLMFDIYICTHTTTQFPPPLQPSGCCWFVRLKVFFFF